jgi:hypothetical protein
MTLSDIPKRHALHGTVWGGGSSPLPDAEIEAWRIEFESNKRTFVARTTTEADGTFSLSLVGGCYQISARRGGFSTRTVEVEVGDAMAPLRLVLDGAVRLRITVRDENGNPVVGARVLATERPEAGGSRMRGGESSAEGSFDLDEIELGSQVTLLVSKGGFRVEAVSLQRLERNQAVDVNLATDAPLEIEIVDAATREPIPAASLAIEVRTKGGISSAGGARAERLKRGRWLLHGLPRVGGVVRASAAGYRPWSGEILPETTGPLRVALAPLPGVDLHGLVRDVSGSPVANARVSCLSRADRESHRTYTDERGRFVIRGVSSDGLVELTASTRDERYVSRTLCVKPDPAELIELRLGRTAGFKGRLVIEGGGSYPREIRIRFDDLRALSGESLGRKTVQYTLPVGSNGQFGTRGRGMTAGVYDLAIVSGGLLERRISGLRLEAGRVTDLGDVVVQVGCEVALRIVDSDGRPVRDYTVVALCSSDRVWTYGYSDREGHVRLFGRFPEGTFRLIGRQSGGPAIDLGEVRVRGPGEVRMSCVVRTPAHLRVLVRDGEGTPASGCEIQVRSTKPGVLADLLVAGLVEGVRWRAVALGWYDGRTEDGRLVCDQAFVSDGRGIVDVGLLDPGEYLVRVGDQVRRVVLATGEEAVATVTLEP